MSPNRRTIAAGRAALAVAGFLIASVCSSQSPSQPAADSTFAQIVVLESVAATAAAERRYPAAIDSHSRALQIAQTLRRPRLTAVLLTRLGQTYEDANKIQRALVAHELALKALGQEPSLDLSPVIDRLGAGSKGFDARPDPVSPDLYRESAARDLETEEHDGALPVRILINIGNGYLRQPQDAPALLAYEAALQRPEIARAPLLKGYALANSGEILRRQGKLAESQSALETAIALIERNGKREDTRRALTSLARLKAERSQTAEASRLYEGAIGLYRSARDERGEARAQLGQGYLELTQNHIAASSAAYRRALELGDALGDEDVRWQANWGLGRGFQASGDFDRAAASFSTSLEFIADREGDLATDEGKVALIQQARDAFDQLLRVQLERGKRDPARYADALSVAEQARARALSQLMQGWSGNARPSPASLGLTACYRPPQAPRTNIECRPSLVSGNVPNQMARGTAAGPPDCEPPDFRSSVAQMAIGTPTVPQAARATPSIGPPPLPPGALSGPPPLPALDAPLPALPRLVFHVLDDRTAVFAVARDGTVRGHVVPIGAEAMTQRVRAVRESLAVDRSARNVAVESASGDKSAVPAANERQLMRALYAELIAPVADGLPAANDVLVIEPHGPLWLVPFAALLRADESWFGDRYQLVYAPSASTMDERRRVARLSPKSDPRVLAIGNPVETVRLTAADDPFRGSFAPLLGAEQEARNVTGLFPAERAMLLVGARANLEAVEKEAKGYSILHFATHGLADPDRPLDSFLLLATSSCEDRLSARRIMTLPLSAELVTLSACQTGLGKVSGEGVIGLSRAFFVAGARSVLVSLWSVSDEATKRLMTAFYRHYVRDGMTKTKALDAAMREVRAVPEFAEPRYWAPFILIGSET